MQWLNVADRYGSFSCAFWLVFLLCIHSRQFLAQFLSRSTAFFLQSSEVSSTASGISSSAASSVVDLNAAVRGYNDS